MRIVIVLCVGLVLATGNPAKAFPNSTPLNDQQREKVEDILDLMKKLLDDCLKHTLEEIYNPPGQEGAQVCYETVDGKKPTLEDAINQLRNMLDTDRIRSAGLGGPAATVDHRKGIDSDRILVSNTWIDNLCSTLDRKRVKTQLSMMFILMNEMVHVYQKFVGDDAKQCDAERDSDDSSLKILKELANAMHGGDCDPCMENCTPHDSLDDIEDECLRQYLEDEGIDSANDIKAVANEMEDACQTIAKRKKDKFEKNIERNRSWGAAYYGSGNYNKNKPFKSPELRFKPPAATILTGENGEEMEYPLPPGIMLLSSMIMQDDEELGVLLSAASSVDGERKVHFWRDADGLDGLPDPEEAVEPVVLPPGPPGDRSEYSMMIFPAFPLPFSVAGFENGVTMLDTADGSVHLLELDGQRLPAAPPMTAFADPTLSVDGGFVYLHRAYEIAPGVGRFIFSNIPDVDQFGDAPAVWFDVAPQLGDVQAFTDPNQTLAMARAGNNPVGIERLSVAALDDLRLVGDPDVPAVLLSLGRGLQEWIADGWVGSDGRTEPLIPIAPIEVNDLFMIDAGGRTQMGFLPRVGWNVDCTMNDENGDEAPERFHFSVSPARLHVLVGAVPGDPTDPTKVYAHEIAMEHDDATGIRYWSERRGRVLQSPHGDLPMTPIGGVWPPLYVQTVGDFDVDGIVDEAVAVLRDLERPTFQARFYRHVTAPVALSTQEMELDASVEPAGISIVDLNFDSAPEVAILDQTTGRRVLLVNDGTGVFNPTQPGDTDGDGDTDLADHQSFPGCHFGPGTPPEPPADGVGLFCEFWFDLDGDGDVDLGDHGHFAQVFTGG